MTDETVEETTAVPAETENAGATEPHPEPESNDEPEGNEPEGEEGDEDSDGADTTAKPKKPNWAQKRINELTRARRDAERDRDYWRRVATGEVEKPQPKPQETNAEPNPKDFTDQAAYWRAVARYEARQELVQEREQTKQAEADRAAQERVEKFLGADQAFAESNPDYRGAQEIQYDPDFPINEAMAEAVFESDLGPQLLHYLDTNRDEAAQIAQMSNARAIAALGRIEERLSRPEPRPQPKPVTQAPPPPPSAKPKAKVAKDPDQMTTEEYMEWRRKQLS